MNSSINNNPIMLILVVLIVLVVAGWIMPSIMGDRLDHYENNGWTGPFHMMGMGGFWMFPFFPFIVLAVILYFVFGRDQGRWSGSNSGRSALEILNTRYAKGEITKEEFEEMKKDILS